MIRAATSQDIPRLVEMGLRFRKETSYDAFLSENPKQMEKLGNDLLKVNGLLVAEKENAIVGMLGFIVHDHFISGEKVAGEVFWWVEPEYRGEGMKLLKTAEQIARQSGATQMQMIAPTEKVESVYRHLGYTHVEATYQKPLTPVIRFDDFAHDALAVREAVIRNGFSDQIGPDGAKYTGISLYPVHHWYASLSERLGKKIIPRLSCFRINYAGELPHSWVHSDDICAKYATVLYLNRPEQERGGTAFWKHKERGIDRLPSKPSLTKKGIDADAFYKTMDREWKELQWWERVHFEPMKWNRLLTYPTCLFHSRYPFEGFGTVPEDGRLIWICFYDLESE